MFFFSLSSIDIPTTFFRRERASDWNGLQLKEKKKSAKDEMFASPFHCRSHCLFSYFAFSSVYTNITQILCIETIFPVTYTRIQTQITLILQMCNIIKFSIRAM